MSSARIIALVLLIVAVAGAVLGYLNQHSDMFHPLFIVGDFYANISTELASIAITVLVIDALNERRAKRKEKANLVFQMGSPLNMVSREAIRILRAQGWLTDGSLRGEDFSWANWENAYLEYVDLSGAHLHRVDMRGALLQGANLEGVHGLSEGQLVQLYALDGATMPNGSRYDGRYNLKGDLWWAYEIMKIDPNDSSAMAQRYGTSVDTYLEGQEWARRNLKRIHQEFEAESKRRGVRGHGHQPVKSVQEVERRERPLHSVYTVGILAVSTIVLRLLLEIIRRVVRSR